MTDESHNFNIESIHSIENFNDLQHLNQLNSQLRYELRNLNGDVEVDGDIDVDVDFVDHVVVGHNDHHHHHHDSNGQNSGIDRDDHNRRINADNDDNHFVEEFNEDENEPFKSYIKSIVERSTSSLLNNRPVIINANEDRTRSHGINNHPLVDVDVDDVVNVGDVVDVDVGVDVDVDVDVDVNSHFPELQDHLGDRPLADHQHLDIDHIVKQYNVNLEEAHRMKSSKLNNHNNSSSLISKMTSQQKSQLHKSIPNSLLVINKSGIDEKLTKSLINKKLEIESNIKKCSRCRMKRIHEPEADLLKYQTCSQCRERRKVKQKKRRVTVKTLPVSDDWKEFINKVSLNTVVDLMNLDYKAYSSESLFPRYKANELTTDIVQSLASRVLETYLYPLQDITGFRFAVRDHHNPTLYDDNRAKKLTWMFICSQDISRRRKSRSENKRQVLNKLKTEDCCSKITLSYDVIYGIIQINYNHKHHKPLKDVNNNILGQASQMVHASGLNLGLHKHATGSNGNSNYPNGNNKDMNLMDKDSEQDKDNDMKADEVTREVVEAAAAAVAAAVASRQLEEGDDEDLHDINNEEEDEDGDAHTADATTGHKKVARENEEFVKHFGNIGESGDVDVDIDVEDVAEIAKLLKQVQQAQSRRLDHDHDHDHD